MNLRLVPEAETELTTARDWYESQQPGLGIVFVFAVDAALDRIITLPESCSPCGPELRYRRVLVSRFPYQIIFNVRDETIHVLAVAHLKRRPGYWIRRR